MAEYRSLELTAEEEVNDEGVPVQRRTQVASFLDGSENYYCGRRLPGSWKLCGPAAGPSCASCRRYKISKEGGRERSLDEVHGEREVPLLLSSENDIVPVGGAFLLPYSAFVPHGKWTPGCCWYLKTIVLTLLPIYGFLGIVFSLSHLDSQAFEPCTDRPCDYMRIFPDVLVPGTDGAVVRVQNGIYRPLFMNPDFRSVRTVFYIPDYDNITEEEIINPNHAAMEEFLNKFPDVRHALQNATQELSKSWWANHVVPLALQWLNAVRRVYSYPTFRLASAGSNKTIRYQFGHIRPARCLNSSLPAGKLCDSREARERINNFLATGKSLKIYIAGLSGWGLFKILHDFLLVAGYPESLTLSLGAMSVISEIVAAVSGLVWSFGALGIFASSMDGITSEPCSWSCYYRFSAMPALLAVSTPAFILYLALSKIKAFGFSLLNGDYVYIEQFDVPFRLVRRSPYWTQGTLLAQGVCGDFTAPSMSEEEPNWDCRLGMFLNADAALSWGHFCCLCVVSGTAVLRLMDLGIAASPKQVSHWVPWAPAVITVLGLVTSWAVKQHNVRTLTADVCVAQYPHCMLCRIPLVILFALLGTLAWAIAISVGICLVPTAAAGQGNISLLQGELWVNGGFWIILASIGIIQGGFFNKDYIVQELMGRKILAVDGRKRVMEYRTTLLSA